MCIFRQEGGRIRVILLMILMVNSSVILMAQKANVMMVLPDHTSTFVDLKKIGVKENYDKHSLSENQAFKPHSNSTNNSSVRYEFVIFTSESDRDHKKKVIEGGLVFIDRPRFKDLGLSIMKGDPYSVFNSDFNVLISDRIAHVYFGNEDPINKILILDGKYAVMIKGVFKSKETKLPMEFDFIAGPITNEKIIRR